MNFSSFEYSQDTILAQTFLLQITLFLLNLLNEMFLESWDLLHVTAELRLRLSAAEEDEFLGTELVEPRDVQVVAALHDFANAIDLHAQELLVPVGDLQLNLLGRKRIFAVHPGGLFVFLVVLSPQQDLQQDIAVYAVQRQDEVLILWDLANAAHLPDHQGFLEQSQIYAYRTAIPCLESHHSWIEFRITN